MSEFLNANEPDPIPTNFSLDYDIAGLFKVSYNPLVDHYSTPHEPEDGLSFELLMADNIWSSGEIVFDGDVVNPSAIQTLLSKAEYDKVDINYLTVVEDQDGNRVRAKEMGDDVETITISFRVDVDPDVNMDEYWKDFTNYHGNNERYKDPEDVQMTFRLLEDGNFYLDDITISKEHLLKQNIGQKVILPSTTHIDFDKEGNASVTVGTGVVNYGDSGLSSFTINGSDNENVLYDNNTKQAIGASGSFPIGEGELNIATKTSTNIPFDPPYPWERPGWKHAIPQ